MESHDVTDAASFYDDLLVNEHFASTHEILARGTREHALTYLGRPVCSVLRPCFIDEATYDVVCAAGSRVGQAISAVARRLRTDPVARAELRLGPLELMLAVDSHQDDMAFLGRLDGFIGPDGDLKFIEYNPSPGGLTDVHELVEIFDSMPVMQAFRARYDARGARPIDRGLAALRVTHERSGGAGMPRLGIVSDRRDNLEETLGRETTKFLAYAQRHKVEVRVESDAAFEYRGGRLLAAGAPVDIVQVVAWENFVARHQFDHPVMAALRDNAVRVLNGVASSILNNCKAVFALLDDPAYVDLLPADVAAAVRRHVPWTRMVRDAKTQYGSRSIDLLPYVAAHRESLVLKPNWGRRGEGVVLGWQCDEAAWQRAIADALAGNYVVQERVGIRQERFPMLVDGALRFETLRADIDPYVWNGAQAEGCFVRVSNSDMLNMATGLGSNAPLFTVRRCT